MIIAPSISIVAPLPLRSRKIPSSGVRHMARIGKKLKSWEAVALSTPRVISR